MLAVFPNAGARLSGVVDADGGIGGYLSSSNEDEASPSEAWGLQFDFLTSYARETKVSRYGGCSVRPVFSN